MILPCRKHHSVYNLQYEQIHPTGKWRIIKDTTKTMMFIEIKTGWLSTEWLEDCDIVFLEYYENTCGE